MTSEWWKNDPAGCIHFPHLSLLLVRQAPHHRHLPGVLLKMPKIIYKIYPRKYANGLWFGSCHGDMIRGTYSAFRSVNLCTLSKTHDACVNVMTQTRASRYKYIWYFSQEQLLNSIQSSIYTGIIVFNNDHSNRTDGLRALLFVHWLHPQDYSVIRTSLRILYNRI